MKIIQKVLFGLIIAASVVYCGMFIYKTFFYVNGKLYVALFDDSMISMTYARNLARGYGLVWNPGDRVEGFTNPLWVVFMAIFHLFPIPDRLTSLYVEISGAVFFIASLFFVKKIAERVTPENFVVPLMAVFMTAFYYPLVQWSLIGTEVSVLLLICTAAVWLAFRSMDEGKVNPWLYVLMGVGTLVRMDMAVLFLTVWGFLFLVESKNRWRHLAWGAGTFVAFIGGQTLFRWLYYGELLPATYYLKMGGVSLQTRVATGWEAFKAFAKSLKKELLPIPFLLFLFKRDKKVFLLALATGAWMVYSIYVGGDAWEHRGGSNRFISLGMPFFMVLFSAATWQLINLGKRLIDWVFKRKMMVITVLANLGLVLFCCMAMLFANRLKNDGYFMDNLRNLHKGPLRYAFLYERSIFVPGSLRYANDGLLIREFTTPEARIGVVAAGNVAYFADRYAIDIFGKSDYYIAKSPVHTFDEKGPIPWRPGHTKWDYAYSLGKLQPDVVSDLILNTRLDAEQYLQNYEKLKINGHNMYFKKDSPYILWDKVYQAAQ